jgi:hypothetical protein
MPHFLVALIQPTAVLMLAVWVFFFFSLVWGGFGGVRTGMSGPTRAYGSLVPFLFFLLVFVVALIAWLALVFG